MPCLLAVLVLAAGCHGRTPTRQAPPDVILIVVDALRADRVRHALDGDGASLPHLTRLAEDAVVYTRATSPATWCIPAHASLLTGRWPSFHGAERHLKGGELIVQPLDPEVETLSEILRAQGLRTAAFVPGRNDLTSAYGFDRGFEDFVNDEALVAPSQMSEAVARWLDVQSGSVFLFVSLDGLRLTSLPTESGDARTLLRADLTKDVVQAGAIPPDKRAAFVAEYDSQLGAVDRAVGDILAALQANGRYAGALIVVTADHGEMLGEHGLAGSGWPPFEEALNVPLIVKYPGGRAAGERVERRVSTLGVFASILETVGAALPDDVQARPLDDHHPVWAEDVDRKGRRVRAGYDGLREKIIRVTSDTVDVACRYDMYMDAAEVKPECGSSDQGALNRAMAAFSKRPRPGEPTSGLARAADGKADASDDPARATN